MCNFEHQKIKITQQFFANFVNSNRLGHLFLRQVFSRILVLRYIDLDRTGQKLVPPIPGQFHCLVFRILPIPQGFEILTVPLLLEHVFDFSG